MTNETYNYVKILFRFYSDVLEEETMETMWAEIIDQEKGLYKIDNIPFYASIAADDIVFAEYDKNEEMLTYRETVDFSGNSTVQVVRMDEHVEINELREIFKSLNCETETLNESYFVMNIPANLEYRLVKAELKRLQEKGMIAYAEPCLSEKHWEDSK